jgi:TRAP-type C4-dicarboxylate transport system permease small subunit
MELVVSNLSPRLQMICDFAYIGCALWLIFLLGRAAWHELLLDYDLNRVTEYVQLPNWLHDILILAMCAVLIFYYIMRLIASILGSSAFSRSESAGMED